MLVYIKTSCIQEILQDISEDDVDSRELIQCELTKEIEELANQHKFYEIIVFTPSLLQNNTNMKRSQYLFDSNRGLTFYIEKEKNFGDLNELLFKELCTKEDHSLALWMVNIKKHSIRMCDVQSFLDKPLSKTCNKDRVHFYVEILSLKNPTMEFQTNKHALIFIKEYDFISGRLIFHTHRYFMLSETVADLQAFIKDHIKYDGDTKNIAIVVEKGAGDQHSCREWEAKHPISKIATKFSDTHSAMVVFEIIDQNRTPKYIQIAFGENSSKPKRESIAQDIENGIHVDVKNDDTDGYYVNQTFSPSSPLSNIVDCISNVQVSIIMYLRTCLKNELYKYILFVFLLPTDRVVAVIAFSC